MRVRLATRGSGGYCGYKVHALVCMVTGLPIVWRVETAKPS